MNSSSASWYLSISSSTSSAALIRRSPPRSIRRPFPEDTLQASYAIHPSAQKGNSPKFMRQNTYSVLALHLASMVHDGRLSPLREAGWKGEDTYVGRSEQGPSVSFLGAREPVRPGPP